MKSPDKKHWLESRWIVKKKNREMFELKLEQMGSLGFFENLNLDAEIEAKKTETELVAYFHDRSTIKTFKQGLKTLESPAAGLKSLKRIPEGNWATAWKKYFKPFVLTHDIVIRPSWEKYEAKKDERVIVLDPGMAFRTGQHDTTRFCAELIVKFRAGHPSLKSFLDIGCGSGILSLIARKTGFEEVTGIDNDPASIEASLENLGRNPDTGPIRFMLTEGGLNDSAIRPADVVAANIIAETLCEMSGALMRLTKPGGFLILSGILPERADLVEGEFKKMKLADKMTSKDWHAYVYTQR